MKRLKNILILVLLVQGVALAGCEKNFPDGGAYEEPTFLKIVGGTTQPKNSTRDYYTYYLDNGDYVWTVPADAQITSPQGKSKMTVKFGVQNGKITVKAKGKEASIDVTLQ
ncbi:hypothetical protein EXU57_21770 [Segetibacter sp. 3557_3]|uniref:hypothetical protein n=1 Tax=Segetibacter sp. 3557_3 TaxID=2547429 RepID=UPI001058B6D7|nr:hypothetical protein [Segetibacter sp. 3557_3]TDH20064.1 hypothetical protein EXU57_21770 [Segetibacter sp. 3557_3]